MQTSITAFLVVKNCEQAIKFYTEFLGATVNNRYENGDGRIGAELSIDGAVFHVGDEEPEYGNLSPESIGGSPVRMVLTVADPDAVFNNAVNGGAQQICPVTTEESWRIGKLKDPFGHIWEIGHPVSSS